MAAEINIGAIAENDQPTVSGQIEHVVSSELMECRATQVLNNAVDHINHGSYNDALSSINEAKEMLVKLQVLFEEVSHHYDIDVYDLHYDKWTEIGGY
tara:strand:- start:27 stop:320 length:294 start_codon:yes stop_codon:yes gene_type:complete